eukprot:Pompholyxophrys_sp_v1_NODE_19_length_4057_cov_7.699150.p4 type:complete len:137 gc:universal NODE_19_length_4057_cov_7.699150:2280-2690(+)
MRNEETHDMQCTLLEVAATEEEYKLLSIAFGINFRSQLCHINGFLVTSMMPFDIMHTILEGPLSTHVKLIIRKLLITDKLISLEDLNARIKFFDLGPDSDSRPSPIKRDYLTEGNEKLSHQSASQIWLLARMLSFR